MRDMDYLKQALEIENKVFDSAKACYEYYERSGDVEMALTWKSIIDDEKKHVSMIKELIDKLKG